MLILKQLKKMVLCPQVLALILSTISNLLPNSLAMQTPGPSGSLVETEGIPDNRRGP